jgi:putative DNA primase/helicase
MQRLVGNRNTCSPTLAAFGRDFGKQVLVGKTLAIISDARISGRTDTAAVAETLLSISGEDTQTVERKFLPDWNGKLSTRFLILTNELPRITDVSGALAKRFIVLALNESFYGKEDLGLFERFIPELPGILRWALEGRDRLYARGYFLQPKTAAELMQEFHDLGSPEATFLHSNTKREAGAVVSQKELFTAWVLWCKENGRDKPGTAQTFGRNIRAALPWVTTRQLGERGQQERYWEGLRLLVREGEM